MFFIQFKFFTADTNTKVNNLLNDHLNNARREQEVQSDTQDYFSWSCCCCSVDSSDDDSSDDRYFNFSDSSNDS